MALLEDGAWQGKVWTGALDRRQPAAPTTRWSRRPATCSARSARRRRRTCTPRPCGRSRRRRRGRRCRSRSGRAVLRRAGEVLEANAEEIKGWLARESGAILPFGDFQVHTSAPGVLRGLGAARRTRTASCCAPARRGCPSPAGVPAGVVGVIAPFNVPTILAIRAVAPALALGNAVILKPDPRTAISGGAMFARVFEEAGLPAGVLQVLPGGADVGEALVVEPAVRVIAFTGSTARRPGGRRAGRPAPQAGAPGARRQLGADRAARRRRPRRGVGRRLGHVRRTRARSAWPPSRHLVHARHRRGVHARSSPRRWRSCRSATRSATRWRSGPLIDAGQRDRVHGLVTASVDGGATVRTGGTYEGLFYRPTVLGDVSGRRARLPGGDLRPGRAGDAVLLAGRGRRAGRRHRVRAVAGHPDPRRLRRACSWPSGSRAGSCTSTTRP